MATIKAVVRKGKQRPDGLTKVNIAVCHQQKTCYIPLEILCKEEDFLKGRICKGKNANAKNAQILEYVNYYKEKLEQITNIDAFSVSQIKEHLVGEDKKPLHWLSEAFDEYIGSLKKHNSINVANNARKLIQAYNKGKDVHLESIDRLYVESVIKWMGTSKNKNGKPYKDITIANYISVLCTVLNYARKNSDFKVDKSIIKAMKLPKNAVRENDITADIFAKIRDYEPRLSTQRFWIDMFVLSFYLGGMNMIDIIKTSFLGANIVYKRSKIEDKVLDAFAVRLPLVEPARAILDKYINKDTGKIDFTLYSKAQNSDEILSKRAVCRINYNLSIICKELGIDSYVTFYSARKFFAQTALNLGISDNVINYILGHSIRSRGIITHYSRVNEDMAEVALDMVIEYSKHPEDIKELYKRRLIEQLGK